MKALGLFIVGVITGVLLLGGARLVALPPERPTHYHANFAVFVDGRRIDLRGRQFMEDVSQCAADPARMHPRDRVHLHNGDHDVVHVHADAATWGHLFANLNMGLGETWLITADGRVHAAAGGRTLKFVLNGEPAADVANRTIRSGDRLLISYGPESETVVRGEQFDAVLQNAEEFNNRFDPGGCGSRVEPTMWQRLQRAFWFHS